MYRQLKNKTTTVLSDLKIFSRDLLKKSDYERWGTAKGLNKNWDSRTKKIAGLIDSQSSIIEFGAGRLVLKSYIPSGCQYTPSDLVDRGGGTIVCDLNKKPLPEFQTYDFAVFSGVLEYVYDVESLVAHLSHRVSNVVASYAVLESNAGKRRQYGWVNHFKSKEFIDLFEQAGFQCDHQEAWGGQLIYRFRKKV